MSKSPPSVYLFFGDDEHAMGEEVEALRRRLGDPSTADLNFARFAARSIDLGALEEACASAPFLADRRLVILDEASKVVRPAASREHLLAIFDRLPPTTALVLLDPIDLSRRAAQANYQQRSPLYTWIQAHPERGLARAFVQPRGAAFVRWLESRAQDAGGRIESDAAQLLAAYVLDDPQVADMELSKLLDYVDFNRPISRQDVEALTPMNRQSDVFAMVDALGQRQGQQALAHLHTLLKDEEPLFAFSMIVRQFRLIVQAREALDSGVSPKQALDTYDFVVNKVAAQARNFTMTQLETIYQELAHLDVDSKTGRADLAAGLDRLVASIAA